MAFHTQQQLQQQQAQHQEYLRQLALSQQRFAERQMFEAIYHPQQIATSASTSGGGGNSNSVELTPFILQGWAIGASGGTEDWSLYSLYSDGTLVPVENAPPLEGPTVFAKNTINGFHYFVTYNMFTETANVGEWDSTTGEWQFLEEGNPLLRNLIPASLQYIEGNELGGNYFIYTDNSQYIISSTGDISPKTFRIDSPIPGEIELTELHEWATPELAGNFPASTFYQLPVAVGASPSQGLFQVQQYGFTLDNFPLSILYSVNGDTYDLSGIDIMSIDGLPIDAAKVAFILDRTDYENVTYFNVLVNDKINNTQISVIAKFDPTSENPANLTSIYQYKWEDRPYLTLTTI